MTRRRLLPREELLLAILRLPSAESGLRERVELLNDPQQRTDFARDAGHHGVLGAALHILQRTPELAAALSEPAAAALFGPLPALRRQAALWDLERGQVLRRLQSAGVDPTVLKGSALRMTTYTDGVERSFSDLDVLVQPQELDAAVAALEAAKYVHAFGDLRTLYRAHHFHFVMQHPRGFTVELHWALTAQSAQVRLDVEAFRARSVRLDAPNPTRVPSPEDMVLHIICQNLEDGFGKLRRTVDIHRVISRHGDFDWRYLVESAVRGRANTAAALALQLSRRLLWTHLPQADAAEMFAVPRAARAGLAVLQPAIVHVHHGERVNDLRHGLLYLWTARGRKSWFWALRQQLRASHYRFWWVASARPSQVWLRRAVGVAGLLALQAWAYGTAVAGLLTRSGRAALRFWTA